MRAEDALSRMVLLAYDYVNRDVPARTIVDAFQNTVVRCITDAASLRTSGGQNALVTLVSLIARMGIQIELEITDVDVLGHQPPLKGKTLGAALIDFGANVIPGTTITTGS